MKYSVLITDAYDTSGACAYGIYDSREQAQAALEILAAEYWNDNFENEGIAFIDAMDDGNDSLYVGDGEIVIDDNQKYQIIYLNDLEN